MSLLSTEARALFLAVKPAESGDDDELTRLLNLGIDWKQFAELAERERLASVAWARLRPVARSVPRDVALSLDGQALRTHLHLTYLSALLDRVIRRFGEAGIPTMLLKGAALGRSWYPSYVHRPMNDLDVLVHAAQAETAWSLLRADGWTFEYDKPDFYRDHHHLRPLIAPRGSGILEIHHSMLPLPGPFLLEEAELWRSARRIGDAWIPSPEHQLLHVCVHLGWSDELNHGITRAARDVATLTAAARIDWNTFIETVHRARATTCAFWTLSLARTLMNADVPPTVLDRLRPRQPHVLSRILERAYIASGVLGLSPSLFLTHRLWTAGVQPARSGHGAQRPWHATTRFYEIFDMSHDVPLVTRVRMQIRDAGAWFRFARTIGGSS